MVHPPCDVRCVSTSHITAIAAVGSHSAGPAASCFASIVPSMLPLPFLARHAATRLAAPGCAGAAPLCCALYRTPRNTNARPARPAAFAYMMCVCVCVGWCMMSLCRSMCFLLSGQLSFAIRLLQLSVGLAVALHLLSVAFSVARVIGCSPTATRNSHAVHPTHTALTTLSPHPA